MKINSNKLSKKTLAFIVDQFRPYPITDKVVAATLKSEMIQEAIKIASKQERIQKELNSKKVTLRSSKKAIENHNKFVTQYNKLGNRGNALLKSIKEIEQHYPELKKEAESCQKT